MIRSRNADAPPGLEIAKAAVSDNELRMLWTSADKDRSGTLIVQEFADFLKLCQQALGHTVINTDTHNVRARAASASSAKQH